MKLESIIAVLAGLAMLMLASTLATSQNGLAGPRLKAWVDKTLPTLEDHVKTIEGTQTQMRSAKK